MRIDPDPASPEPGMLSQYLDYQRETILSKTDGRPASSWHSSTLRRSSHSLSCSITCRWWKRTGWRCASLARWALVLPPAQPR
jgi:hypothetical protein